MLISLKKLLPGIPNEIRIFLTRALLIFIGWKLLYHFILFPTNFPDSVLTRVTGQSVSFVYKQFAGENSNVKFVSDYKDGIGTTVVHLNDRPIIGIADSCNGLELHVIYIAFLFCLPVSWKRQVTFLVIGVISIFIINIMRCLVLLWLKYKHDEFFNFAHHYLFYMVVYSFIFFLWYIYAKKLKIES